MNPNYNMQDCDRCGVIAELSHHEEDGLAYCDKCYSIRDAALESGEDEVAGGRRVEPTEITLTDDTAVLLAHLINNGLVSAIDGHASEHEERLAYVSEWRGTLRLGYPALGGLLLQDPGTVVRVTFN